MSLLQVWQCFYDAILADGLARFATITVKVRVLSDGFPKLSQLSPNILKAEEGISVIFVLQCIHSENYVKKHEDLYQDLQNLVDLEIRKEAVLFIGH